MAFDAAKSNGRFGHIQCQRSNECSSIGKRQEFICRRTVRVKVEGKVILASFLKIEGRRSLGQKTKEREGQIKELVGDQNPGPEAPPRSRKDERGGSKGDIQRSNGEGWVCQGH